jgi:hypothetical protein
MTTGEPKMTEMSKPAEILYRAFFDELRFAKQQQWTVTNYTLLLMGAAYGLAKLTAKSPPTPCARGVWCAIVAAVAFFGLVVLIDLEVHLRPAPSLKLLRSPVFQGKRDHASGFARKDGKLRLV